MKGKLIIFEGLDLTGKTTIIEKLKERHSDFIYTREPGGIDCKNAEKIRKILLDGDEIDPLTEVYLFAAARAEHIKHIKELLDEGKTIVCDRSVYSSLYYQGVMKKVGIPTVLDVNTRIFQAYNIGTPIVFYVTANKEERVRRLNNREYINKKDIEAINKGREECYREILFDIDYIELDTSDNDLERVINIIEEQL